ncbi:CRISPR-associated protein cas6/csy4, subtype I-f/ypest [Acinetobacter sp. ANC 3789]|uniref:type I-F CRISPR-associated endoribonuclease Cas6/Csy4 n=1 Tax=Acinetobacter sp. ANC 3789 TaxID=1217714 RepID=UPI0002CFF547|nr:type I-F CRISPR-associated endoribonuclease Cas6/Csy4 [Acinetobacter sp. ANC 3789]ENU79931.1 CRISPR-associated protein cas6/csy4, subtype I-f/ypest [Acinetobacter sp. ANC 3789]
MKYYLEIKFLPDDDISIHFLWSKIYKQLHLALASIKNAENTVKVGFSFPQYRFDPKKSTGFIGEKLRVFASSEDMFNHLEVQKWLSRYVDYVHISSIKAVPMDKVTGYAIYKRKQVKSSAERLARAEARKGRYSYEDALAHYCKFVKTTNLPYIQMLSDSSSKDLAENCKHHYKLFIEKQIAEKSETQVFSTYGLSSVSSVPEF